MQIFKRVIRIVSYVLFAFCIIGLVFCAVSSDQLDIINYEIKGKEDFSCLIISDYHHRSLNFSNGNMIDILSKQEHVDYVFFTGDLIDSHTKSLDDVSKIFDVAKGISSRCFFVTGNHEEYAPHWSKLQKLLDDKNITYLKDKDELIGNVHLYGLEDARFKTGGGASFKAREEEIMKVVETFNPDPNNYNVLLVHRPENFKAIAKTKKFDLVLSGHTHGGQFRIGNWVPTSMFQEEGDYMGGQYQLNNTNLVVSRGLGYSAMFPIRVNCNPEIVKVTVSK